jgi:type IV pilus assembly protein PilO
MPRSFSSALKLPPNWRREPQIVSRLVLGVLLVANIFAAWTVVSPVGGSSEELEAQIAGVRVQIEQRRTAVERLRNINSRVEQGRTATDEFMLSHFMTRRTASSTIVSEIIRVAKESGMRAKEHAFAFDPIEGTEDLTIMTVTGSYEGTYGDLLQFINRLDKSPRFLIVDTLTATPVQGSGNLTVSIKMNTFVREESGNLAPAATASLTAGGPRP